MRATPDPRLETTGRDDCTVRASDVESRTERTTDEGRRRLTERARRQDCNVGDYVIIKGENEDGEEEDWFGQARDDEAKRARRD